MRQIAFIGLLMAGCGLPAVHNTLTAEEKAAGWRLLFDGNTMAGWEDPAQKSPPGDSWVIEDGCLQAVKNPRIREDLLTKQSFEDFELAFEWRISPGGNSGVKYRIQDHVALVEGKTNPQAKRFEERVDYEMRHHLGSRNGIPPGVRLEDYLVAFEYQLIDNKGHPDAAAGADRLTGSIYSLVEPTAQAARPVGEFNQSRIVLRGNRVEHWLNGVKVIDTNLNSPEIAEGLARRWSTASPVYQLLTKQPKKRTPIALQHHNDKVWFRNIKIREL